MFLFNTLQYLQYLQNKLFIAILSPVLLFNRLIPLISTNQSIRNKSVFDHKFPQRSIKKQQWSSAPISKK